MGFAAMAKRCAAAILAIHELFAVAVEIIFPGKGAA
jgi:hypothetical protein